MRSWKMLCSTAAVAAACVFAMPAKDHAQLSVGVNIGAAPVCPYGYFDYAPYSCAPYGYYGPDWFDGGGVFIGAGPWFHGPRNFYGHVDNRWDPHHGYAGPLPGRGEPAYNHFHGNVAIDPHGHPGNAGHGFEGEHQIGPGFHGGGGGEHGGGDHGGHR